MLTLDDLLAPVGRRRFDDEFNDRKPLHIPAGQDGSRRRLLDWDRFNHLLDQSSIWTAQSLKLVFNGEPIPPETYCVEAQTQSGPVFRPAPARVQTLLANGASLIAGDVQGLTPELAALSRELSEHFAGLAGVNVYCSFGGVQAFNTHYDLHHVFAVQVEGEKTWRLYANRADAPVDLPPDAATAKRMFEAGRGPLMQEVRMRPGDVLYLPRGWHHDALATEGASLHVTFSVTPLYGRILFRLLESAALQDPAFRAWLRPASEAGGAALRDQLMDLGRRLAHLTTLPEFADEVAMAQERLIPRDPPYELPRRMALTVYRPTGLTPPAVSGPARVALEWAMTQPQVALEDMIAQFDFVPPDALRAAIEGAERAGALKRLTPA
ncbi:JmjC domain-containing protein [Phenylobacterium sp.]|uniref:JmjC domain-containing protein n=1 Tax=Phenylobacterium sp. TaxID=1871053 RepID=UPI00281182A6|nr:cupin domain-containing protein [Phenylobacterium sp.]